MKKNRGAFAPFVYIRNSFHPMPRGQGLYSGLMFTYYMGAACTSFIAAYLAEQGLPASRVGTVMAIVSVFGILSTPVAGSLSDRLRSPRPVVMVLLAAASLLFLSVGLFGNLIWFSLLASTLILPVWSFFKTPIQSLLDSMTVQTVNRRRTFTYGSVRCLGSIGYGIFCFVITFLTTKTGSLRHIFFSYGILNLAPILLLFLDREDKPAGEPAPKAARQKGGMKLALSSFYFKTFLISYMFVCVPVYCLTTFLPYKLIQVCGSSTAMGTIIALKGFMEVPALLLGARIANRLGQRKSIILCICIFALEQTAYLFAENLLMVTGALLMHGLTYGLFLSCAINYIYMITPHEASASAQTVAGALTSMASILGSLAGGLLVDAFGPAGYYTFTLTLEILALTVFLISFPIGRKLGHPIPGRYLS